MKVLRNSASGPITVSTVSSTYGPVSIENVIAYLKNNVTQDELEKLILLEFRELPPISGSDNSTEEDIGPAIIPVMGGIFETIITDLAKMKVKYYMDTFNILFENFLVQVPAKKPQWFPSNSTTLFGNGTRNDTTDINQINAILNETDPSFLTGQLDTGKLPTVPGVLGTKSKPSGSKPKRPNGPTGN